MENKIKALAVAGLILFSTPASFAASEYSFDSLNNDVVTVESESVSTYSSKTYDSGVKDWLGGKWRHGVNSSHVWSQFYHGSKYHNTKVKGAGVMFGKSGRIAPNKTAYASWEKALFGNEAYANVE